MTQNLFNINTKDSQIITLDKDIVLFDQDDECDALYIVKSGCLIIHVKETKQCLGYIYPGDTIGESELLFNAKTSYIITTIEASELLKIPSLTIEKILNSTPNLMPKLDQLVFNRLRKNQLFTTFSHLFGNISATDFQSIITEIEWHHLQPGDILFRQGDVADSLYFVISGHLHAKVKYSDHKEKVIGEIFRDETIGELALINQSHRTATIEALRNCDLVRVSKQAFHRLSQNYSQFMISIMKIISDRQQKTLKLSSDYNNVVNIAVIGINKEINLTDFCDKLQQKINKFGSCLHISSTIINNKLRIPNISQINKSQPQNIRLVTWLDDQETRYRFIIYQADIQANTWTERCLRRADQILLVGNYHQSSELCEVEQKFLYQKSFINAAEQRLILLHINDDALPKKTSQWLQKRLLTHHHHLRLKQHDDDFARLARFISKQAIGLVLSGGGARGFSHIGVFHALKEAGINIDVIGGTSVGAYIGALCAAEWPVDAISHFSHKLAYKPYSGLTLPFFSLLRGKHTQKILQKGFNDLHIEDLWLNFFCISSSLTTGNMHVHRYGELSHAIRASSALPGIFEPVVFQGELLVDGGLTNNIPYDVMYQYCQHIIVSDVSSFSDLSVQLEQDYFPSPWKTLIQKLSPFHQTMPIPSILDILAHATLMNNNQLINNIKKNAHMYFRPPVGKFRPLDLSPVDSLINLGYEYTKSQLK